MLFKFRNLQRLHLFPWKLWPTEVSVSTCDLVDWSFQVQLLSDGAWSKVEVFVDDCGQLFVRVFAGTVAVDKDGQWAGDTDGVRDLD